MTRWLNRAMVALLIVIACGTTSSGATYTASSTNPQTFEAAADFGLSVEMDDPGPTMRGSRSMSATPTVTDGVAVQSVAIQRAPTGTGTWTTICTDSSAPYACALDTTTLSDGGYDFRALATNVNGYTRTSTTVVNRLVDNTAPAITQADPGLWFRATLTLSATTVNDGDGSGVADVTYQYKSTLGAWTTACTAGSAPFACSFPTAALVNGANYDFRAVATDVAGNSTTSATYTNRKPDNAAPSGSLADPGPFLRSLLSLTSAATDVHSGVASVTLQFTAAGGSSWSAACVDTTSPFDPCAWDTTTVADGLYDLRVMVTDVAGNTATSSVVANRRVDNVKPTASLTDPLSPLSGSVTLTASSTDTGGSGVANVKFQRSAAGANTWTDLCTDTTSAYTCSWNTATVPEGLYDLRTLATDNAGNAETSTVVTNRRIDNFVPSASDVQTANGGATPGVIQAGDTMTLTYSEEIDPASIIAGWDGTGSQSVFLVFTHNKNGDRVLFYSGVSPYPVLPLATGVGVDLNADYVPNGGVTFNGTLTRSGRSFTLTIGTSTGGVANATAPAAAAMQWFPSSVAKDFVNKSASTTARTETGASDAEF